MTKPYATIYIRVPYALKKKLEEMSQKTEESMTALIIKAARKLIEENDYANTLREE